MIVVADGPPPTSCHYCVIAHGAILRIRAKNPVIADQIAVNYRKGRHHAAARRAMLDFSMKVSQEANTVFGSGFCGKWPGHGFFRRRHLGYRRDRSLLSRLSNRAGQRHRDAPE